MPETVGLNELVQLWLRSFPWPSPSRADRFVCLDIQPTMQTNNPPNGGPRRRHLALLKARKVFELYVQHYGSYQAIADHPDVNLSKTRVAQIIQDGMREVTLEVDDVKSHAVDVKLVSLREAKGQTRRVFVRPCPVCRGVTTEFNGQPCEACNDSGFFYELGDRMKALAGYLRTMDQESKLLGEYTDERPKVTANLDLLQRMASLPEDELDEIIAAYCVEPEELHALTDTDRVVEDGVPAVTSPASFVVKS
jgi:hypothetical protein